MKILFPVFCLYSGGAERTVSYLSKYLAERGHEVYIMTWIKGSFYKIDNKVREVCLNCLKVEDKDNAIIKLTKRGINLIKNKIYLQFLLNQINPDVVFCMITDIAPYFMKMHDKGKFVMIASERNNPLFHKMEVFESRKRVFAKCEGVVFQTERAKKFYPEEIQNKSIVIANAVGNPDVYNVQNVKNRRKVICAVGRLVHQKDYPTLLKAFKTVYEMHSDFTLEIYGDGKLKEQLEKEVYKLGLKNSVRFMGTQDNVILKIADAACYCMSSVAEGMPNALMEAMAAGIPCVATDCPFGPAELIKNEENGLLVPVGDSEAMAEAIKRMIEDEKFAEKCSKNAMEIRKSNSVEKKCGEYEEYILQILSKSHVE